MVFEINWQNVMIKISKKNSKNIFLKCWVDHLVNNTVFFLFRSRNTWNLNQASMWILFIFKSLQQVDFSCFDRYTICLVNSMCSKPRYPRFFHEDQQENQSDDFICLFDQWDEPKDIGSIFFFNFFFTPNWRAYFSVFLYVPVRTTIRG